MTPEQQRGITRQRMKALGVAMAALSVAFLTFIVPNIVQVTSDFPAYVKETAGRSMGGDLVLSFTPTDANWTVTLAPVGNQTAFASGQTDAAGHLTFNQVAHAVAELRATYANATTIRGLVLLPQNATTHVNVTQGQPAKEWLTPAPVLPGQALIVPLVIVGIFALGVVAGVGLFRQRMRRVTKVGAILLVLVASMFVLSTYFLYALVLVIVSVWAFITVRKNPQAFEPAPATATP